VIRTLTVILAATTLVLTAAGPATAADVPVETGQLIKQENPTNQLTYIEGMNKRGDMVGATPAGSRMQAVVWWNDARPVTVLGVEDAIAHRISENGHHVFGQLYNAEAMFRWDQGKVRYLYDTPTTTYTLAGVNNGGHVVGTLTQDDRSHAFEWHHGRVTLLPTPAGMESRASGVNNRNQIIGTLSSPGTAAGEGVIWQGDRVIRLGSLGGGTSGPAQINDRGQVIGGSTTATSSAVHPFLWQRGRMIDLFAGTTAVSTGGIYLSDTGLVGGNVYYADGAPKMAIWRDGRMIDVTVPGYQSIVRGINDRGELAGHTWKDPGTSYPVPFRRSESRMTVFPDPPGNAEMEVIGIDPKGSVGVHIENGRLGHLVMRSS
jgi:probable HAF family extracellular repeat protein